MKQFRKRCRLPECNKPHDRLSRYCSSSHLLEGGRRGLED